MYFSLYVLHWKHNLFDALASAISKNNNIASHKSPCVYSHTVMRNRYSRPLYARVSHHWIYFFPSFIP